MFAMTISFISLRPTVCIPTHHLAFGSSIVSTPMSQPLTLFDRNTNTGAVTVTRWDKITASDGSKQSHAETSADSPHTCDHSTARRDKASTTSNPQRNTATSYAVAASLRSGSSSWVACSSSCVCFADDPGPPPSRWWTTSSAVAGPKHNPEPSCPAATNTLSSPGTGPIAGKPPTAYGRKPARVDCSTSLLLTAARCGKKALALCSIAEMMSSLGTDSHPLNSLELPAAQHVGEAEAEHTVTALTDTHNDLSCCCYHQAHKPLHSRWLLTYEQGPCRAGSCSEGDVHWG